MQFHGFEKAILQFGKGAAIRKFGLAEANEGWKQVQNEVLGVVDEFQKDGLGIVDIVKSIEPAYDHLGSEFNTVANLMRSTIVNHQIGKNYVVSCICGQRMRRQNQLPYYHVKQMRIVMYVTMKLLAHQLGLISSIVHLGNQCMFHVSSFIKFV